MSFRKKSVNVKNRPDAVKAELKMAPTKTYRIALCGTSCRIKSLILLKILPYNEPQLTEKCDESDVYETVFVRDPNNLKDKLRIYRFSSEYENIARIQNLCSYLVEGIIMVVDVESECSFLYIKDVKKEISKIKNKEVPMVILYDTSLQPQEKPTFYKEISTWAETEKIKIFDTQLDSNSNIFEAFKYLIAKMTTQGKKGQYAFLRNKI
uniref:NF-kappa-B inhibitor-interacting Ras-like protein 2 (Trinotate prediction) n=1 Tax=Henneguya salminicola TaxID=69463 RepID=A0A6G3MJ42_HENSL